MDFRCIDVEESFEAFDYLRKKLINDLQDNKLDILFFEDRKGVTSNVIVVVIRNPQKHGVREHAVLKCPCKNDNSTEPQCRFLQILGT